MKSRYKTSTLIPAREAARQRGEARYKLETPCQNGHFAERRVSDKVCVACERAKERRYLETDRGKAALLRKNNSDIGRARRLRWTKTPHGRANCNKHNKTDKGRAARKRFFQTDKGKACVIRSQHARRARIRNQVCVQYSYQDRLARFAFFGNACAYCGQANVVLAEDHFISLKHNGGHFIENIVPACKPCNSRKNASHPAVWYKKQTFFSQDRWNKILQHVEWKEDKIAA